MITGPPRPGVHLPLMRDRDTGLNQHSHAETVQNGGIPLSVISSMTRRTGTH